ncbi:hypothetical protein ABT288_17255 [Streptomyces sp. NPDC001093]|uniref:hypothetical protein n=1 Tax=Streptomyces sp. NPDC001093 TaxID=3154376 RepID=UPI003325F014
MLEELLNNLADGDGWDAAIGAPVIEKMATAPGIRHLRGSEARQMVHHQQPGNC